MWDTGLHVTTAALLKLEIIINEGFKKKNPLFLCFKLALQVLEQLNIQSDQSVKNRIKSSYH